MPVISSCWSTVTWSASSCWRSSVARNAPRQFTSTSATSRGSAERSPTWPRDDGSRRFKDVAAMPPDGLSTTQTPGAIGPSHRVRLPTVEDTQAWVSSTVGRRTRWDGPMAPGVWVVESPSGGIAATSLKRLDPSSLGQVGDRSADPRLVALVEVNCRGAFRATDERQQLLLSLIHISEPTRQAEISYAV